MTDKAVEGTKARGEIAPYTGTPLTFHHVCLTYEDIDEAIHLWCDVLGFELTYRGIIPDPQVLADNTHMADSYDGEDHYESETVTIGVAGKMVIELQRPIVPKLHTKPARENGYNYTGLTEIAFQVDDIDFWHQRIIDAGYRPQSEPWQSTPYGSRTFVFYDHEGNIIQLWQEGDLQAFIAAMSAQA